MHYWSSYENNKTSIITPQNKLSFEITNLTEKTWYQICIATIDDKWTTSRFKCEQILTDFSTTGPVTNINVRADVNKIFLSWQKPEYQYDIPQGYVVTVNHNSTLCQTIIIKINESSINNNKINNSCAHLKYEYWAELQTLEINNLTAFTNYTINIIPINGNKSFANHKSILIQTKQGESEAVQNLSLKRLNNNQIKIDFLPPINTNGIIIKYKINMKHINICTNKSKIIDSIDLFNKTNEIININNLLKCRSYLVEISPINGWNRNGGAGKSAVVSFRYKFEYQSNILINIKLISRNSLLVQINQMINTNQCDISGYFIEITNTKNYSDCIIRILTNIDCQIWKYILTNQSNCTNQIETKQFINQSLINTQFIGFIQYPIKYHYKIFIITDQIDQLYSGFIDGENITDMNVKIKIIVIACSLTLVSVSILMMLYIIKKPNLLTFQSSSNNNQNIEITTSKYSDNYDPTDQINVKSEM